MRAPPTRALIHTRTLPVSRAHTCMLQGTAHLLPSFLPSLALPSLLTPSGFLSKVPFPQRYARDVFLPWYQHSPQAAPLPSVIAFVHLRSLILLSILYSLPPFSPLILFFKGWEGEGRSYGIPCLFTSPPRPHPPLLVILSHLPSPQIMNMK